MQVSSRFQPLGQFVLLSSMLSMPALGYNPDLFQLNIGETAIDSFGGSQNRSVKIVNVQDFAEQGHWEGGWRNILYKSLVTVEVDGVQGVVGVGPFQMPKVINGLRIGGELTKAFTNSAAIPLMSKDVQLTAKDASLPWYDPGTFTFPLTDYRWGSGNFHNAWLGFHDMSGGKLYYHHGIDFGGFHPNLVELVSMIDNATISSWGVGTRLTNNAEGLSIRYYHMDSNYLRDDLGNGSVLDQGEMFGYLGNVGTGNFGHLHIDARYTDGNQPVNIYPMLVQAYLEQYNEPLAFPGHKRHAFINGSIELDGSNSVAPEGRSIVSYEWTFTDGTTANTPIVNRTYVERGTYSEQLTITDSTGARSTSSVMVFVYDPARTNDAPYLDNFNQLPSRDIKPGDNVLINYSFRNTTGNYKIDFGDGTVENLLYGGGLFSHQWDNPGEYTITMEADGHGGHGIFKQHITIISEPTTIDPTDPNPTDPNPNAPITINFSELSSGEYTLSQSHRPAGLDQSMSISWHGWAANSEEFYPDHTSGQAPNRHLYAEVSNPRIQFSSEVFVDSFWLMMESQWGQQSGMSVQGIRDGQVIWSQLLDSSVLDQYIEITAGSGLLIDELRFFGAQYNYIDDISISTEIIPEPASLALLAMGGLALLRRR